MHRGLPPTIESYTPKIKWSSVREKVRSFDLVVFEGSGLVSSMIRTVERRSSFAAKYSGRFSHVGILIKVRLLDIPMHAQPLDYVVCYEWVGCGMLGGVFVRADDGLEFTCTARSVICEPVYGIRSALADAGRRVERSAS
jgi:hypothetical protein